MLSNKEIICPENLIKIAKKRFNGLGSIACAKRTPIGVVRRVMKITTKNAIKLIDPIVKGGLYSEGIFSSRNPKTDGKAMTNPNPDAVAIAR